MKKILLVTITAASLFTLVGCGNVKSGGSKSVGDIVEIQNDKGLKVSWKDVTPIMEDESGLKFDVIDTAEVTAYTTNIKQSLSAKSAPDLFTWWTGTQLEELVKNDLVTDLTDVWPEFVELGVSDGLKDAMTFDGKIYGTPLNVLYNGVLYNKQIFNELSLEEPKSMTEFLEVCETIKKSGTTPIGIGSTWQSFVWPMVLMGSLAPDVYDGWTSGEIPFDDPRVKEVFYAWVEMLEKGYFSEQQQDQGKDLGMKEVAMILNANNFSQGLEKDYDMKLGEDIDIFVLPAVNEGDKKTIFYEIAPFIVAKNGDKDKAVKALKSYYKKEAQEAFAAETGGAAITDVTIDNPVTQEMLEAASDEENYALKLRYYEYFTPEIVNLSIDEYWKIAGNPTNKQVDESLSLIQGEWEKVK